MSIIRRRFVMDPLTPIGEVVDLFFDDEDEIEVQVGKKVLVIRRLRENAEKSESETDPDTSRDGEAQ